MARIGNHQFPLEFLDQLSRRAKERQAADIFPQAHVSTDDVLEVHEALAMFLDANAFPCVVSFSAYLQSGIRWWRRELSQHRGVVAHAALGTIEGSIASVGDWLGAQKLLV